MKLNKLITESRLPKVGIFWIIGGDVISFLEEARDVSSISGFKDATHDHHTMWDKVVTSYPKFRNMEYYEVPRGRVLFAGPRERYEIITSKKIAENGKYIRKIMREFSLPISKTAIVMDEHYEIEPDLD